MGWEVVRMRSLLFDFPPQIQICSLALLICVACISPAHGQIVINEIYYDHPGKDDGYEFVELINIGPGDICVDALRIEFHNGSGSGWDLVWQGSPLDTIRSSALFVVGGNNVIPRPDAIMSMSLQNGPDALRLLVDNSQLDLVGYGSLQDADFVEGDGAGEVLPGFSLCRQPDGRDTNNNLLDFHAMEPSPGQFNLPDTDVSLALTGGTEQAVAVNGGSLEEIRFLVENNGIVAIPAGEVSVQLWDSSQAGYWLVDEVENTHTIEAGYRREMAVYNNGQDGYHFLKLQAFYAADQRPNNNTIDLVRRAGSPDILISEVMSCPTDPCPQYIEIFNAGSEPYDMRGHVMRDRTQAYSLLISQEHILDPNAYIVLSKQKEMLLSFFPALFSYQVMEVEGTWPHLNHSGSGGLADSIFISDRFEIPIEAVGYPPQSSANCGRSLERVDLFASTCSPVWILSQSPNGGSPGMRNEASILASPGNDVMSVTPNPFSPGAGEKLLIVVGALHGAKRSSITVFDTKGRTVTTIGSSSVHPYVFIWDGTRDNGIVVPSGLYILACELYSSDGKRLGVEKVVVGCGRKRRR
jgi:hypothetical protein